MSKKNFINVTLVKSLVKCIDKHKACIRGLGIKRMNHTVTVVDSPETRGMINKVAYLLKIEEK